MKKLLVLFAVVAFFAACKKCSVIPPGITCVVLVPKVLRADVHPSFTSSPFSTYYSLWIDFYYRNYGSDGNIRVKMKNAINTDTLQFVLYAPNTTALPDSIGMVTTFHIGYYNTVFPLQIFSVAGESPDCNLTTQYIKPPHQPEIELSLPSN